MAISLGVISDFNVDHHHSHRYLKLSPTAAKDGGEEILPIPNPEE